MKTKIIIDNQGRVKFIHNDRLVDFLRGVGGVVTNQKRVSNVEPIPDTNGKWEADMSPISPGTRLGPFDSRDDALNAELAWLDQNNLVGV